MSEPLELTKPKRSFSRLTVIGTVLPAWLAVFWSIWDGVDMARAIAPTMVILIASVIGVYQGVGHFDLRSQLSAGARPSPAPRAPRSEAG
ncbi:hypothetical protein AB4099_05430 [Bosea sp. 2KB_26]|uniref:hypothetical protein n=1 Tax=Bosea sp. 2KB_26 TaxID=3237475 RepID=UPI003F9390D5